MDEKYNESLNKFIVDFNNFVRKDEYLQKRDFYELSKKHGKTLTNLEKHKDTLPVEISNSICSILEDQNFSWIDRKNEQYIAKKLQEEKEYFDTMFTKYSLPIVLDEEQRKAILSDCEASLIIAGAGTGKTTTMTAKVKYLVEKQNVKPNKILVLSYTNKAINELKRQIQDVFKLDVNIITFHALGRQILKEKYPNGFITYDDIKQERIIFEYVSNTLFPDKNLLKTVIHLYPDCFSKHFKDNFEKFKDFQEYFKDYKNMRYEKELEKGNIKEYLKNKEQLLMYQEQPKGLDFQKYRSKKEASIANFLFKNNIEYKYEIPVPFTTLDKHIINPDFTVEINGKPVIIEYFGLLEYNEDSAYPKEKIEDYRKIMSLKEQELKSHKFDYIFLEGKNTEAVLNDLKQNLIMRGFTLEKKSDKVLYMHLLDDFLDAEFHDFIEEMVKTIGKLKENCAKEETFTKILEFYRDRSANLEEFNRHRQNVHLIKNLFYYYQGRLKEEGGIDFSDMINEAYEFLKNDPNDKTCPRYEYLLIDEYQDVSFSRFLLARQIVQNFKTKIIAVGDDWQTIFTFAGSNIKLFYDFKKQFPIVEEYKITRTYRNSQQLIDTAGKFILKNEEQIKKQLTSSKNLENPIEIIYYQRVGLKKYDVICTLLDEIYEKNKEAQVFFLARRNIEIENILKEERFFKGYQTQIIYKKHPDLKIEGLTIHKAKGLTCDEAIVLDLKNGVFPSTRMEKNIIYHYYRTTNIYEEEYPFAEERRLFYVALTRTKNKVYLLSSENGKEQSIFIKEIKEEKNVIERKFEEVI